MGKMKQILLVVICVALVLSMSSCMYATVNEDRDNAQVVAEVNGTPILKSQFNEQVAMLNYYYNTSAEDLKESMGEDGYKEYMESVVDDLVGQELLFEQAKADGLYDDSEEHKEELRATAKEDMDTALEYYEGQAETAGESQEWIDENYNEYLESMGYNDMDTYIDQQLRSEAITAITERENDTVTYTEDEAKAYYDEQVSQQQTTIEKDPENAALYEQFGTLYVYPEGYRYAKNILIPIPEDKQTEINALREEEDDAAADVLRAEELAKIKDKADEVLAKLDEGGDFDELMAEYGEDPGMQSEPDMSRGYLVYEGSNYVPEFVDATMALAKEGDYSDLVTTDYGYHIIQYTKDAAGPVDFEYVKQDIIDEQLKSRQTEHLTEYTDGLKENAKITKHMNRVY